jgi:outer membrane biosynthesis protein TonB
MSRLLPRAPARLILCLFATLALVACASNPDPDLVPDEPVRVAPPDAPVKQGDCAEALRRANARADVHVDRLPTPRSLVPAPLPVASMPDEVRRAKYNTVKVTVLVDTLGRPDMRTFKVVKATHPWLASSVKSAVAKWRFEPAQLAGCKVPRQFEWGATSGKAPRA